MQQGNLLNNLLNLNPTSVQAKSAPKTQAGPEEGRDFQAVMAEVVEPKPLSKARQPAHRITEKTQQTDRAASKAEAATSTASRRQTPARSDKAEAAEKPQYAKPVSAGAKISTTEAEGKEAAGDTTEVTEQRLENPLVIDPVLAAPEGENPEIALELLATQGLILNDSDSETEAEGEIPIEVGGILLRETEAQTELQENVLLGDEGALAIAANTLAANGATGSLTSSASTQASMAAARATMTAEQFTANPVSLETSSSDILLTQEPDSETGDLDLLATVPNLKQFSLKAGENLLAAQEKVVLGEVAKTAAPGVTSLVDALGRPQENPLASTRSFTAQINLPQTMGQPQWNQGVSERVLWMAAQNLTAADIRLDPPELGSMHVKVTVQQDQASVTFASPHPAVREALDQQATRLREMFAEQGLNLVNVDVSDRHAQERQSAEDQESSRHAGTLDEEDGLQVIGQSQPANLRLIDHYA